MLLLMPLGLTYGDRIIVNPPLKSDCMTTNNNEISTITLDTALDDLQDDTILVLGEGCYKLTQFRLINDLTNITIQGSSNTTITCARGISLAFFDITDLRMEGNYC